jgi:hypothetical protein
MKKHFPVPPAAPFFRYCRLEAADRLADRKKKKGKSFGGSRTQETVHIKKTKKTVWRIVWRMTKPRALSLATRLPRAALELRARLNPAAHSRRTTFREVLSPSLRAHIETFGRAGATKRARPRRWPRFTLIVHYRCNRRGRARFVAPRSQKSLYAPSS